MNTQHSPVDTVVDRIDQLVKANLALHVARSSAAIAAHRTEFVARQEAEVLRQKEELTTALQILLDL